MGMSVDAAAALLSRSLVWDNHACMPLRYDDDSFLPQLERFRLAGVNAISLNVGFGEQSIGDHIRMLAHFRSWLGQRPDQYRIVEDVSDLTVAKQTNRLAVCFDIEGMKAIGNQLSLVRLFYDLGVRSMVIAYNQNNAAGGGCQDNDCGLTDFGRQVIDEMGRVGMVVCCSHTGYRTAREAIEYSSNPVIFSHSNPRRLWDHPRNIPDELMIACADRGGVIGINGLGIFLGQNDHSTTTLVRHIDYAIKLVGADHVGLGLDYVFDSAELDTYMEKMAAAFPQSLGYQRGIAMVEPERLSAIVTELLRSGHPESVIEKVLGANFLRIARSVWK
jgi:membrane dipeptidase